MKNSTKAVLATKDILLSEVIFDEKLYPRKQHCPALVQQYADVIDEIEERGNFMTVAEDMTLLDGRHRHLAYLKRNDGKDVNVRVFVYQVKSEAEKFATAVKLNSSHGKQLTLEDKRRSVLTLFTEHKFPIEQIAKLVSVRKATALDWTKAIREEEEHQLNETIFDLWLACYTAVEISQRVGIAEQTVRDKIKALSTGKFHGTKPWKLSEFSDFDEEDLLRPIYNVWRYGKNSGEISHFGNSDPRILDRLLYLYTKPFDTVVDVFGGGGSTLDVCKNRLRRYWISDRKPIIEREHQIRKLDVTQELPPLNKRWSEVSLTFLDPPYWKQAEGKYSDDQEDLANMSLEDFNKTLSGVVNGIAKKQSKGFIAMLMQPTQWNAPDKEYTDHVIDMVRLADAKRLKLVNRISCPYSSQQCKPQMVEYAKENKMLLVLSRELIVWKIV
ncbi:MAG: site-specific DNA-methyltransferase [Deltaproteobacteria bacterium]|nr:site-specific DNA-methyltransferase [Deltaproteobacteria bacterium]